jgi:hypothetical protein
MSKGQRPPDGEIRRSQVVTTFGPGAMVDLPDHSILVGGLDFWRGDLRQISEPRLRAAIASELHLGNVELKEPPTPDERAHKRTGIEVFLFPQWFVAQVDDEWQDPASGRSYRTRPLVTYEEAPSGRWRPEGGGRQVPVVPVRFVQACSRGHLSDIDWHAFVRRDWKAPRVGRLWLDEGGAGNDFADIYVRDESRDNARRPLADMKAPESKVLGRCNGLRPWLGWRDHEPCDKHARMLVRSASNAYFPQKRTVISIPEMHAAVAAAVDKIWEDHLKWCEDQDDVRKERRRPKVAAAIEGFSDDEVWEEIQRRLNPDDQEDAGAQDVKAAEITTLLSQQESLGEDRPEGDFYARARALDDLPPWLASKVERVVLVHRLREVTAQIGFTRLEYSSRPIGGEAPPGLDLDVRLAPLSSEPSWMPAAEMKGEGVFIAFREAAIGAWLATPEVVDRGRELLAGTVAWVERRFAAELKKHGGDPAELAQAYFPGLPYLMLHSLSHLLITAVALDCGYAATSISERVYAGANGYGILLYTGSPGSEGTLGGLVEVGHRIERHLEQALRLGRLCGNDPVCADHRPAQTLEERFRHGAACHGCLLIAETCCEAWNAYLDRALVVPTVATTGAAFFADAP